MGLACWGFAQEEGVMIINPGRETFLHFPSSVLGNQYTLTVFLPEEKVPLSKRYPVVYVLGAGPQQAQQAQAFVRGNGVLAVGINFTEKDYQNRAKIVEFISRELIPYIDTNYLTFAEPSQRFIAAQGTEAALTAMELFAKPHLFGGLAVASAGDALARLALPQAPFRVFVSGTQQELALAQERLQWLGAAYGEGFALAYAPDGQDLFAGVDYAYLSAPKAEVALRRLKAVSDKKALLLDSDETARLEVQARLANGRTYAYVPVSLRMSPPYLQWNAARGELRPLAGAEPGKVKITENVDKKTFSVKIKLKKQ